MNLPLRKLKQQKLRMNSYFKNSRFDSFLICPCQVCSDTQDVDVCCQTGDLKKAGTNGWARNKKETWPLITLGRCAGEKFPIQATTTTTNLNQAKLELTLNKRGNNKLELSEFIINAEDGKGAKRQ